MQRYKLIFKFRHLAEFYSPIWLIFIHPFGLFLFTRLADDLECNLFEKPPREQSLDGIDSGTSEGRHPLPLH